MKQILINTEGLQTRTAVVENGKLQDFFIERKDGDRLVGSLFKGRIKNLEPSLQAAFVDIGTNKNAFLHYWDMLPATQEMLEDGSRRPESRTEEKEKRGPQKQVKQGMFSALKKRFRPEKEVPVKRRRQNRKHNNFTVDDIPNLFQVDSEVIVQVTKGPIGTKGARVTTNLSIPGRYLVLLPNSTHVGVSKRVEDSQERDRLRQIMARLKIPSGMGLICRTVGAGKNEKCFQQDLEMLLEYWSRTETITKEKPAPCCIYQEPDLVERCLRDFLTEDINEIVADSQETYECVQELVRKLSKQERVKVRNYKNPRPIFSRYNLKTQVENVFRRKVPLPSGGYLCVDETEALIAIDINSGKNRAGKDHPETIVNTNLEAVDEIARQLRLRNIGGLVVIDFIDMRSRRDQHSVFTTLKQALLVDRAKTKVYPITPLGLVEMTRQREHESLRDTVYCSCPYCGGKGLIKSPTSMSVEIQRRLQEMLQRRRGKMQVRVTVHPHVLERLKNEDSRLIADLEEEFGGELSFRADALLHQEEFRLVNPETDEEL